jgi:rsbT co-antagonist protein RsbR
MTDAASNGETLEQELARVKLELSEKTELLRVLFDANPDGIAVADPKMNVLANEASAAYFGTTTSDVAPDLWSEEFGIFDADGTTPRALDDLPLVRAMRGETISDGMLYVRSAVRPKGAWLSVNAKPLDGGGAIAVLRDITDRKVLEDDLARRNEDLATRDAERTELVEQLRLAVEELSVPVLEVWKDVLAAPIIGVLDSQRCAQMSERILEAVVARRARSVIIDLTGVNAIDTATAQHIGRTAHAVGLVGSRCIITGIQPAVAASLVHLDIDLRTFHTEPSLRRAIEYCIEDHDSEH